jgi:importin subunit alpha-6/7
MSSANERKTQYKKGVSIEDGRRRRQDTTVQIRKSKRQEQLKKRRNMNKNAQSDSAPVDGANQQASGKSSKNLVAKQICFNVFGDMACDIKNIENISQAVKSNDPKTKYAGIRYVRKLLSVQNDPPVEDILNAGLVPFLVEAIQQNTMIEMVFEAAWALTNIASTQHTNVLVESGACGPMINLLCSYNPEVREQAAWCLGNVAGDCTQYRNMLLDNENALKNILLNLKEPANISLLRNVTWCLSNFCRGKPQPDLNKVQPAIGVLLHLIQNSNDAEVMTDALWALSYLSDGDDERINACVQANITTEIVRKLSDNQVKIITPALRIVGNLVSGNEIATQTVMDAGVLPVLYKLMDHQKKGIRKEACWAISNITAGTPSQIETVLSHTNIMKKIIELAEHANWDVRKEAVSRFF